MIKISKKNILFFILGFITYFLIDVALNWDQSVESFKQGYKEGYESATK